MKTKPKITICNLRCEYPKYPWDFKAERSTPVGNPYRLDENNDRESVCVLYDKWFDKMICKSTESFENYLNILLAALRKYGKLRLFCWCSPKQCHVETIKRWLLNEF